MRRRDLPISPIVYTVGSDKTEKIVSLHPTTDLTIINKSDSTKIMNELCNKLYETNKMFSMECNARSTAQYATMLRSAIGKL